MVSLLKQKSKITIQRKPRAKYELADAIKKRKLNVSSLEDNMSQSQASNNSKSTEKDPKRIQPQIIQKYDIDMNTQK